VRPASATDTVETDTHIDPSLDRIQSNRDPRRRPSFDDRRTPAVPIARRATRRRVLLRRPRFLLRMHGALHGTPCAFRPGRLGGYRIAGHVLLTNRTRGRFLPVVDREADPSDVPSPIARCAPSRWLDATSRRSTCRDRRLHPPREKASSAHRSGTPSLGRFHRSGASREDALDADAPTDRLATIGRCVGFLTRPRAIRNRLSPA
jgi:hypothetical protein